jgi:CTP:molybdopterin cytidylyltransferase MocA
MTRPAVLIFHRPAAPGDPPLVGFLAEVRGELARRQAALLEHAGAGAAVFIDGWHEGLAFGEVLAKIAPARGGVVVFGSGAVPRLNSLDARRLVAAASSSGNVALTNNRYSSDIVALGRAAVLRDLPALPSDNALPRWLEERARVRVAELPGRDHLALDLDTPLDVCLAALAPGATGWLRRAVADAGIGVPRHHELRAVARDPRRELLVFGRSGSRTLAWLERNVRCRVRFLAEERGLRASSPLAMRATSVAARSASAAPRRPAATLSLLLAQRGPEALSQVVAELADAALIDSRVLLAARLGIDESGWPAPVDRFASDLHDHAAVGDPWLHALTRSAAEAKQPILLGSHSLVGPGVAIVLKGALT